MHTTGIPPTVIPVTILEQMKVVDFVGYAPNLLQGKQKRNQTAVVPVRSKSRRGTSRDGPRFRSEKERELIMRKNAGDNITELSPVEFDTGGAGFPNFYKRIEIKYSRFGVDDFDFGYYNRTQYCGLETHMPNCYANSFLQLLHFLEPVRKVIIGHMAKGSCKAEVCLACELGYLFRMLETGNGINCQATNFLRALMAIPQGMAVQCRTGFIS